MKESRRKNFLRLSFIPYPYDYDRHCHKVGQVKI